jgi:hypothetical protein
VTGGAVAVQDLIVPAGRADAAAFLARLVRLDADALVRVQPTGTRSARCLAMLPFGVLAEKVLPTGLDEDVTVSAADLLAALASPAGGSAGSAGTAPVLSRLDSRWRWPLPPGTGRVVESIPAAEVHRVAAAAAATLRATVGSTSRMVGERRIRDALLDHVPIVVIGARGERVEVTQRLVQGLVRMGFLGQPSTHGDTQVTVRLAAGWTGLRGSYGSVWFRPPLRIRVA